jgi:hypothetical protein
MEFENMKPYRPSNKVPSAGFMWLLLSSVLGGIAIGGLTFVVSQLIYLIILFPLGMGFAGGIVSAIAIQQGKVRNPLIGSLFAALTGLTIYGTVHGGNYLMFKQVVSQEITKELGQTDTIQTEQFIDAFLKEKTGATGFWGYMNYSAKQGVSIGKLGSEGIPLNETFTWLYWLIEFAAIETIIVLLAYSAAKDPYCESCDRWYASKERMGNIHPRSSENFLNLIKDDNFTQSGKLIEPLSKINASSLEVYLQGCSSCQISDFVIAVSRASFDSKGNLELKQVLQGAITPYQQSQLRKAVNESFSQNQTENSDTAQDYQTTQANNQQLLLAQQERTRVSKSDRFELHGLSGYEEAKLAEQLSRYPKIKEAYLVRKVVKYFPEKPFYVLGVVRRRDFIESEVAEQKLLNQLVTELELPNQTLIVPLNGDRGLKKALQQTAVTGICQR